MSEGFRYGFDTQNGFVVVDDAAKISAYAYPTSPAAVDAAKSDAGAHRIAARMIESARVWEPRLDADLRAYRYESGCRALSLGRYGMGAALIETC